MSPSSRQPGERAWTRWRRARGRAGGPGGHGRAIDRAIDEIGLITDPHRAIDWLSTFPQVVLLALGEDAMRFQDAARDARAVVYAGHPGGSARSRGRRRCSATRPRPSGSWRGR